MTIVKRKIYLASSWKNKDTLLDLADRLRQMGHEVFLFCQESPRPEGLDVFIFDYRMLPSGAWNFVDFIEQEPTIRAYKSDKAGLDWCDTVVLVLPSGRSSHLELGYARGQEKDCFIIGELPDGEFETMYLFANKGCYSWGTDFNRFEEAIKEPPTWFRTMQSYTKQMRMMNPINMPHEGISMSCPYCEREWDNRKEPFTVKEAMKHITLCSMNPEVKS